MHDPGSDRRRLLVGAGAAGATLALLPGCASAPPPMPAVDIGRLERIALVASKHVAPRPVDVWLPPGYRPDGSHAVLYMHDGQMLYDARTTWNRQAWDVQTTAAHLIAQGRVRPFIVVGVWNSGQTRFVEYFPQGFLAHVPDGPARHALLARGLAVSAPRADAYLRFLVEELKPTIDARYRTATEFADTFVAGSSMGGLISLYALCEYPQVFGGAACLSAHWIGSFERNTQIPAAALAYLRVRLPAPGRHRIYMDRGTDELDALYDLAHGEVVALMRERGFGPPLFDSRVFEGAGHSERAWAQRLHIPLTHLLAR